MVSIQQLKSLSGLGQSRPERRKLWKSNLKFRNFYLRKELQEKRKSRTYLQMNIPTYVQRVTGILMILLVGLHIAGAKNHFQPKMLHAIVHPLFFAVALTHISVSVSMGMITLGIGNAQTVKIVDILLKVLCAATFIAAIIGFYLCLFVGVAR